MHDFDRGNPRIIGNLNSPTFNLADFGLNMEQEQLPDFSGTGQLELAIGGKINRTCA